MLSEQNARDYISVTYNEKDKPFTSYPRLLTGYLFRRYGLSKGQKILDLGCGRGDFLKGFIDCGLEGYGVDKSLMAKPFCPQAEILQSDFESETLPYKDNSFDIVFSKSVLEHFYYPEKIVRDIYRILKPGSLVITMVPDWDSVRKVFYKDYTHRTHFTLTSLRNILFINGFEDVKVEYFRQLPFLWNKPWLQSLPAFTALVTPQILSSYNKFVKFSKEVMLLSSAVKPKQ